MTISMFMGLLVVFAGASSLLTEAMKKTMENSKKNPSANLIALINAAIVGGLGTPAAYIYMKLPFSLENNITIIVMILCTWIGSTIGYDKVIQTIKQLTNKAE